MTHGRRVAALALPALAAAAVSAHAGSPRLCERGTELSTADKDRRLRLAAEVRRELDASGKRLALIARSGVNLSRFDQRYSHAGVSLLASPNTPWSVRQLYYACDEGRPRLFDQGLAGFLLAADDLPQAHVWLVLLPEPAQAQLEQAALDRQRSLQLLAATYSANAHAFSTLYQNCNQWLAELLAAAWGALGQEPTRQAAQGWLREQGYRPHRFEAGSPLLFWVARFVPLLHHDDHPEEDLATWTFQVSMPSSIEAFAQRLHAAAERIELCQDERQIVVRRGWQPLGPGCEAGPGDRRVLFDETPPQGS